MAQEQYVQLLRSTKEWFDRATRCLDESDAEFTPVEGTFTTAQHIAHVAQTVDWFMEGAFRPEGFDTDFSKHFAAIENVKTLKEARAWLDRSFKNAEEIIASKSDAELNEPIAPGIMGGAPRFVAPSSISEHTAHHRGALTVYARLRGKTPEMPYMDAKDMERLLAQG